MDMHLSKLWEFVKDREAWRAAVHAFAKNQKQLRDWTETLFLDNLMCYVKFTENGIEEKIDTNLKDKMTKESLIVTSYFAYRMLTVVLWWLIYIYIY